MDVAGKMEGKCLCGAVSIEAEKLKNFEACHCSMCRRWGGGPLLAIHCGPDVRISGTEHISIFNSSAWAERAFCKTCGTHLFYRLKQANQYIVPMGLFQDQTEFEFKEQIFIDRKPGFYEFANKTRTLTEQQVFQKYVQK